MLVNTTRGEHVTCGAPLQHRLRVLRQKFYRRKVRPVDDVPPDWFKDWRTAHYTRVWSGHDDR